jgi:hypothetical protein
MVGWRRELFPLYFLVFDVGIVIAITTLIMPVMISELWS